MGSLPLKDYECGPDSLILLITYLYCNSVPVFRVTGINPKNNVHSPILSLAMSCISQKICC